MALPLGILLRAFLKSPTGKRLAKQHGKKKAEEIGEKVVERSLKHPRGSEAFKELEERAIQERLSLKAGKIERPDYTKKGGYEAEKKTKGDVGSLDVAEEVRVAKTPSESQFSLFETDAATGGAAPVAAKAYPKKRVRGGSKELRKDQDFKAGEMELAADPKKIEARRKELIDSIEEDIKLTRNGDEIIELKDEIERIKYLPASALLSRETGKRVMSQGQKDVFASAGRQEQSKQIQKQNAYNEAVKKAQLDAMKRRDAQATQWRGGQLEKPAFARRTGDPTRSDITTKVDKRPMFAEEVTTTTSKVAGKSPNRPEYAWERSRKIPSDTEWDLAKDKVVSKGTVGGLRPEQKIIGPDNMGPHRLSRTIPGEMGPPKLVSGGWKVPRANSKTGLTYDEFMKLPAAKQQAIQRKIAQEQKMRTAKTYSAPGPGQTSQSGMTKTAFDRLSPGEQESIMRRINAQPTGRSVHQPLKPGEMGPPKPKWDIAPEQSFRGMTRAKFERMNKKKQKEFLKDALDMNEAQWKRLTPSEKELVKIRVLGKKYPDQKQYMRDPIKDEIRTRQQKSQRSGTYDYEPSVDILPVGKKKGGRIKAKKHTKAKNYASKRGDGIAKRGLTKGRMV